MDNIKGQKINTPSSLISSAATKKPYVVKTFVDTGQELAIIQGYKIQERIKCLYYYIIQFVDVTRIHERIYKVSFISVSRRFLPIKSISCFPANWKVLEILGHSSI